MTDYMVSSPVVLGIISAVCYAAGNVMDKALLASMLDRSCTKLFFAGVLSPIVALPLVLVGMVSVPNSILLVAGTGTLFFLGVRFQLRATKLGAVSSVALLLKTIPLFALVLSILFLNEVLIPTHYVGMALVLTGAMVTVADGRQFLPSLDRAALLTLLASFLFASSAVATKALMATNSSWTVFYWQQIGFAATALVLLRHDDIRSEAGHFLQNSTGIVFGLILGSVVLYGIGNMLYILAIEQAPVAIVASITAADALFVIVLTAVLSATGIYTFDEHQSGGLRRKLVAAFLFIAGVAVLH